MLWRDVPLSAIRPDGAINVQCFVERYQTRETARLMGGTGVSRHYREGTVNMKRGRYFMLLDPRAVTRRAHIWIDPNVFF
jgi:hypothetical protein